MKILIDIGHPGHVHYFRNFIKAIRDNGHQIVLCTRDKDVTHTLLDSYGLKYYSRGKGSNSMIGKFFYTFAAVRKVLQISRKHKPDLFLSFASPYAAIASAFRRKPCITLDDTEVAKFGQFLYRPFSDVILTPGSFRKDMGKKQLRFKGFMELSYLRDKYFKPERKVLEELKISEGEKFVVIRFVGWHANHDVGEKGLNIELKKKIVELCSKTMRVIISSEEKLPEEFKQYAMQIHPSKLHHLLYYACFYIGEGATTASECVMLGTPAVYINSIESGTILDQMKYGNLFWFKNEIGIFNKVEELAACTNSGVKKPDASPIQNDNIDSTEFLVWFVQNYPQSHIVMKHHPSYQDRFYEKSDN